ncbi:glutathione S-transferase [Microvirga rosea]|uniref:glutathione S-transferase n=1 Tax=Microvirga rosea TaxID=2715425 RepID=UPI001D09C825|nr:glutathione S-transferase [Microvirga rosea]MCB8821089.1 glutathione S-transferase [Microvirga rosea]
MKLFYSPTSPFVRKVLVVAHELGLAEQIERVACAAHPVNRDKSIITHNPLGQVPTLMLEDGRVLADSRVICEYLNDLEGGSIFPSGEQRWEVLVEQSLADGLLDAALLGRYERAVRPPEKLWQGWLDGQIDKIQTTLSAIEKAAPNLGDRVDIGTISFGCALGYLDLRFEDLGWRDHYPAAGEWYARFDERQSMRETRLR